MESHNVTLATKPNHLFFITFYTDRLPKLQGIRSSKATTDSGSSKIQHARRSSGLLLGWRAGNVNRRPYVKYGIP